LDMGRRLIAVYRYPHSCIAISECWHFRKINTARLAKHLYVSNGIFIW
jgi:hypothetical protein